MKRINEYYIGKPCKMDIGADGHIHFAVGRITGEAAGAVEWKGIFPHPSIIHWTTPHGSTFESGFFYLYELDNDEKIKLKEFEKQAKETEGILWYGSRLNDVSHDTLKLE